MQDYEICVNLWYTFDQATEKVYSLSGRAYALCGTDDEKLALLRLLSATDFHVAVQLPVPQRFQIVALDGTRMKGMVALQTVSDPTANLFEEVFQRLEKDLPPRLRMVNGEPTRVRSQIPPDPLCVTTCVIEDEHGNLLPQLKSNVI